MQATLPLPGPVVMPMPTGSLEAYIQTVNRFPILSAEEERALALRYRDHEDLEAARGLVLSHLRLVVATFTSRQLRRMYSWISALIQWIAKETSRTLRSGSKRLTAFMRPMLPSWMRSACGKP